MLCVSGLVAVVKLFLVMRETGRGSSGQEGVVGVTVAAAVAILERQQQEQRRVAPSVVRHCQRGDINRVIGKGVSRDSSDCSVSSVGGTVARLQSRFSGGGDGVGNSVSASSSVDTEQKLETDKKSGKHVNNPRRNELSSVKKEPVNFEVTSNHVETEEEGCFNDIRKSPSTKNISSLVRNNSVVPTPNNLALSTSDSKIQDVQKSLEGDTSSRTCKVEILTASSQTQCPINNSKISSVKQQFQSSLSTSGESKDPGHLHRSSSAKDTRHHHDPCNYDGGALGADSLRNVNTDCQLQNSVKGSISDSNIPRRRPRVIHLREDSSVTKKDSWPKSRPEVASEPDGGQTKGAGVAAVLDYPPPPPSPPPEYEGRSCYPSTGGSSPSGVGRIPVPTKSLGSYIRRGM